MAVLSATELLSAGSLANRIPKGEAMSMPIRQMNTSRARTTEPPAAAAAIRPLAAARMARRAFPALAAAFFAALPACFAACRNRAVCCATWAALALWAARVTPRPIWAAALPAWSAVFTTRLEEPATGFARCTTLPRPASFMAGVLRFPFGSGPASWAGSAFGRAGDTVLSCLPPFPSTDLPEGRRSLTG